MKPSFGISKEQANMTSKETIYKAPITNSKEMKIYDFPDKEFKIIILKKLSEMQKNIDKHKNKIRKTIFKQNINEV